MFTVKLGTGKVFDATSVCEYCAQPKGADSTHGYTDKLTFEANYSEHNFNWYKEAIFEDGALNSIEISKGEDVFMTTTEYTAVESIFSRLLPTGEQYVSITLYKPVAVVEE